MHLLKYAIAILLGILAFTAGIFVTAIFVVSFVTVVLIRWAMHRFGGAKAAPQVAAAGAPPRTTAGAEVIDVAATEVPTPPDAPPKG